MAYSRSTQTRPTKLHIPQCQDCRRCQRCRGALPAIARTDELLAWRAVAAHKGRIAYSQPQHFKYRYVQENDWVTSVLCVRSTSAPGTCAFALCHPATLALRPLAPSAPSLLQGYQRIDPRRPSCRDVAGEEGDGEEHDRDADERQQIVPLDGEEQSAQQAAGAESSGDAEQAAKDGQAEAVSQNQSEHVGPRRPERHPDAHVTGPLRDEVGEHAEQAHTRERERDGGKAGE